MQTEFNPYYEITIALKNALEQEDSLCKTVTHGAIDDVDLNKQTIFPLSHIIINSCVPTSNTLTFNVSLICMDIVDISKSETVDKFLGNDNEQDVLNNQLVLINRIYKRMDSGDLFSDNIQVQEGGLFEPFTERFENLLAGWTYTFDVQVPNEMTIC